MLKPEQIIVGAHLVWEPRRPWAQAFVTVIAVEDDLVLLQSEIWCGLHYRGLHTRKTYNHMHRVCEACELQELSGHDDIVIHHPHAPANLPTIYDIEGSNSEPDTATKG